MDMKNYSRIPNCGKIPDLSGKKTVVGAKQLRKALQNGCVCCVYLAQNADPALTSPIEKLCGEKNIQPVWVRSMQELGRACGIDVGAAAAAVIK